MYERAIVYPFNLWLEIPCGAFFSVSEYFFRRKAWEGCVTHMRTKSKEYNESDDYNRLYLVHLILQTLGTVHYEKKCILFVQHLDWTAAFSADRIKWCSPKAMQDIRPLFFLDAISSGNGIEWPSQTIFLCTMDEPFFSENLKKNGAARKLKDYIEHLGFWFSYHRILNVDL